MIDLFKKRNLNTQLTSKKETNEDDEQLSGRASTETTPNHLDQDKAQTFPIEDDLFEERLLSPMEAGQANNRPSFEDVTGIN